jgi:SAM-dependent methyltransferase
VELLRRIARFLLWPVRRLLDPRFDGVRQNVDYTREKVLDAVDTYSVANAEALTYVGEELRSLEAEVRRLGRARLGGEGAAGAADLGELDASLAELLTRESSHLGYAAEAGLWFNPPVWLRYDDGRVEIGGVNERIAELPFAYRALARLEPGARVLDVGAAESSFALSLATLGYEVTALDRRPIRLRHPRLEIVEAALQDWDAEPSLYDAIFCISTVEHIGLAVYGEEGEDPAADRAAVVRMRELLRPSGFLVLTVPFGSARTEETRRVYDQAALERLLAGWSIDERTYVTQVDRRTWIEVGPDGLSGEAAALLVASPA